MNQSSLNTAGAEVRVCANDKEEGTLGEQLVKALQSTPWPELQKWLERDHMKLLERINRLSCLDEEDEFRLDRVEGMIPPENYRKMGHDGGAATIWRSMPSGKDIRPGDWVSLSKAHASAHRRHISDGDSDMGLKSLSRVLPSDIYWAGTDEREFFYLPKAWRHVTRDAQSYLLTLTPEQVRILCDGEEALITRHAESIQAIAAHVLDTFDPTACGDYHGPNHWDRVRQHGHAAARANGVDPLIAHIFGWVHDSQREHDGHDLEHGPLAAEFIRANRPGLFGFLTDAQIEVLATACELHSDGVTEGDVLAQVCWDADRLDLWRVGNRPDPQYMCTPYGKDGAVIEEACKLSELEQEEGEWPIRDFEAMDA